MANDLLDFLWFIPSSGDGSDLGSDELSRPADPAYFREIASAVDRLGYSGVLTSVGVACEESFVLAANLAAYTERLEFLVAFAPVPLHLHTTRGSHRRWTAFLTAGCC